MLYMYTHPIICMYMCTYIYVIYIYTYVICSAGPLDQVDPVEADLVDADPRLHRDLRSVLTAGGSQGFQKS